MTDLVYVCAHRRDWEDIKDDEDAPHPFLAPNGLMPASCVPRMGEFFQSREGETWYWWRVDTVAWSSFQNTVPRRAIAKLGWALDPEYEAWVDLVVTLMEDPRG